MLPLDLLVDLSQVVHQLFLLALFPKDIRHLLFEGADDVGMDLREEAVGIRDLVGTTSLRAFEASSSVLGQREAERSKSR